MLTRTSGYTQGSGGALSRVSPTPVPVQAHWSAYNDVMRALGLPESERVASMPDPGFPPQPGEVLSIDGDEMIISAVRRSPAGGVYYVGGASKKQDAPQ